MEIEEDKKNPPESKGSEESECLFILPCDGLSKWGMFIFDT